MFEDTALAEYCKRIIKLKDQDKKTFKLVLDNRFIKDLVVELNTEGQLKLGIDSEGNQLFNNITGRSTYAPSDPLGRGGQPYQVLRTGDYYNSFVVSVSGGDIKIVSNPFKRDTNLFKMYSPELEGLTDKNLQELIDEALELYIKWYRENILP